MAREQRVAEVFVELADTLVVEFDLVDFLHTVTERCMELVPCDAAGLLLGDQRGGLQVLASTSEAMGLLELFQLQRDQGPCLDCFSSGVRIENIDLVTAGDRWPDFCAAATSLGYAVSQALPMRLRGQVVGALGLFGATRTDLTADQIALGQSLADIATIGLLHERASRDQVLLSEQLQTALSTRVLVEQAKGVLSARAGTSVAEAFAQMRAHARRTGRPLTEVATAVVDGQLSAQDLVPARVADQSGSGGSGGGPPVGGR